MKLPFKNLFALFLGSIILLAFSSFFIVAQVEQALILQFGEPIRTIHNPGLNIKVPLIQNVIFYDNRLLDLDLDPEEVIASDQKRLVVDTFLRYKIVDPLRFYQSMGNENIARARLQTLAVASLRRILGSVPLSKVLSADRGHIMQQIQEEVQKAALPFGVDVIDVRIRHADLPKANSEAIYQRMESERKREAKEFRAQGEEFAKKIRALADKERTVILAEAEKQGQILKGEGEGQSILIQSAAFSKNPQFFDFYRSMEAYKNALRGDTTTYIISPTSDFFKFFDTSFSK